MARQDAGLLCRVLADAGPQSQSLIAAIGDYETQMREYGFAAVQGSRDAEAEMGARRGNIMFWLYRHLAHRRASLS